MSFSRDVSLSAVVAGFVTVLVGFTSSGAIVFEAARSAGATPGQIGSWMWALGLGMGLTCLLLSLRYRMPVVTAWSTPGAAMLIVSAAGVPLAETTGAFIVCAVLIAVAGFSGAFERAIGRIPLSIASGLLAGVLVRFGFETFIAMKTQFTLAVTMFAVYLAGRRLKPRYAVPGALLAGIVVAAAKGLLHVTDITLAPAVPEFVTPTFSLSALVGIALPLFVVTMASQNVPGSAVIRASGFAVPLSPVIGWIGVTNIVLAPFGAFALNLAAITAAICMGREAHEDPSRRYVASVAAGIFYILIGIFGATVGALFAAFPKELVLGIAGLALIGTIGNGLAVAVANEREREPALITFLVTASGMSLAGIGSAFWGVVAGAIALKVLAPREKAA
jgi:benzoate membrane transport protein